MWPQVLTFDCYGTLVQWPETLRRFFVGLLPPEIDVAAFHADFNRFHMASKAGRYRPYSVVLTDALADTVDYATLCDDISAIVAGEPVALLERLARLVADRALADPAVRAATVTIAKPHVAIPHVVDDVSVSLHAVADGS